MTVIGKGEIEVSPKMTNFQREAEQQTSKALAGVGKKAAAVLGASLGAAGAFHFFKGVFAEAQEAHKVFAQTEQVIKTTGGAAGVTAQQVSDLSESISKKVGIDDEAIQSGANLLLTFTNLRNEAGKGNDIFNQATNIIADMSVALGQDMSASAIQVGKALQDPIRGVTALRRVGVNFSKDQQNVIANLVQTGHTLDAQKMILKELNAEFGGSAAAQATAFDKLKVLYGNLQEELGQKLMPTFNAVVDVVGKVLPHAFNVLSGVLGGLVSALSNSIQWLNQHREVAVGLAATLTAAVIPALIKFATTQAAAVGAKAAALAWNLASAVAAVGAAFGAASTTAQLMVGGGVLAGIGLLAGLVYKLGQSAKTSKEEINKTTKALLDFAETSELSKFIEDSDVNLRKFNDHLKIFKDNANAALELGITGDTLGKELDSIDKSLRDLVEAGNLDLAKQLFEQIKTAANLSDSDIKDNPNLFDDYTEALDKNTASVKANALNQVAAAQSTGVMGEALEKLSEQTGLSQSQLELMAEKLGVDFTEDAGKATLAMLELAGRLEYTDAAAQAYGQAIAVLKDQTADATEKTNAFKTALDTLLGTATETQAISAMEKSIDDLATAAKENTDAFLKGKTAFDLNKEAGRELSNQIFDLQEKTVQAIEKQYEQGASQEELNATWQRGKDALHAQLRAMGLTESQAQALIDKYELFDGKTFKAILKANTQGAVESLTNVRKQFDDLIAHFIANPAILGVNVKAPGGSVAYGYKLKQLSQARRESQTLPSGDVGGWIPGPPGKPVLMVGHGGEYVLSREMLAGKQAAGVGSGRHTTVNVYPQIANLDEREIARVLHNMELAGR